MYALVVYDVDVKRVAKVHKYLKRYLHWVQNSVFEGELTEAQAEAMKSGLGRIVNDDTDSVLIYTARDRKWLTRETLGAQAPETGNML